MTDTTDIKALRSESANLMILLHKEELDVGVTLTAAKFFDDVFRMLEAERRRADKSDAMLSECLESLKAAEKELSKMKGDQVPVAWRFKNESGEYRVSIEKKPNTYGRTDFEPLFTATQKPVLHPDTKRMNWLVSQHVEVRTPMVYGSHARFVAQCDSDDCEEYHTTLREQTDAAIEAAGGKVAT